MQYKAQTYILSVLVLVLASVLSTGKVQAERIKDIATIQGVRQNQLVGYGLVVGLDGTGEQTPYTTQSLINMLQQMGVNMPVGTAITAKNVAAVMVTANLPPFAQPGQTIDITVSSVGSAKSLRGGTLVMTPLKGADGQVYAMAQGNLVVGGVGASANGSSAQVNHLSVGRISSGATVERALPNPLASGIPSINLELTTTDFSTASMVVDAINQKFGPNTASAQDGRVIRVKAPQREDEKVTFLAALESTNVTPDKTAAKVIMNARTGSVVMTQYVTLESCAVSHGNLSVVINTAPVISQPGALSNGNTVATQVSNVSINKDPGKVLMLESGTSLADVVKALNSIGATPQDLLAILQAMKAAGSFKADLEII